MENKFSNEQVQTIQEQIDGIRNDEKRLNALIRLNKNEDFIFLIMEEFFKTEAVNCVKLFDSDIIYNNDKVKVMNEAKLIAISGLQRWFNNVMAAGSNADEKIEALEEAIK